jgi:toxin ParE1/3/4
VDGPSRKASPRNPVWAGQTGHLERNKIKNSKRVSRELIFHPDVFDEVNEHYLWYEQKSFGLGERFLSFLDLAYEIIQESPTVWPKTRKIFHKYQLKKFPFHIVFYDSEQYITIYAVAHFSRKPFYWAQRATET